MQAKDEYEEYLGMKELEVPSHSFRKSYGDGYPRNVCNRCGLSYFHPVHAHAELVESGTRT